MANIAELNVRIGAKIEALQSGLKKAEREIGRSGRKLNRLGSDLTAAFSLPLAGAGLASLKFATDFETSFTKIETLVGVSGDTLANFKTEIGNLSGPLATSKTALSDALFTITSAGQRGAEALVTLEQASKASAIGLGETKEIARAATAAVTAYGAENLSSAEAIDKFTAIVREGNLEAAELAPQLGKILPIAAQLGVSFGEVGANIATFTRLGVNPGEAVTGLKSLLSSIIKPSEQAKKELQKLGISSQELRESISERGLAGTLQDLIKAYDGNVEGLSRLFPNVEGLTNALGTAGAQGENYIEIVNSISKSNGIVNEGFEKVSETANFKLQKAFVNLKNVGSQFGSVLIPVLTDLLGSVTPLLNTFSKLDESTKKIIVSTGLFAAAVGPILKVVGTAKTTYASLLGVAGQLTGGLKKAAAAFIAFDRATKLTTIGLVATGLIAATVALNNFSSSSDVAAKATERLKTAQAGIGQEVAKERAELDKLIGTVKNSTISIEERNEALGTLRATYPGYFRDINIEKGELSQLDTIQKQLNESILKGVAARKKGEVLNEIGGQIIDAELRLRQIEKEGFKALSFREQLDGGFGNLLGDDREAVVNEVIKSIEGNIKDLKAEANETAKSFDNLFSLNQKLRGGSRRGDSNRLPGAATPPPLQLNPVATATPETNTEATTTQTIEVKTVVTGGDETETILASLQQKLVLIGKQNKLFGDSFDGNGARIEAFKTAINDLLQRGLEPSSPILAELQERFLGLNEPLDPLVSQVTNAAGQMSAFGEAMILARDNTVAFQPVLTLLSEQLEAQNALVTDHAAAWSSTQEVIRELTEEGGKAGTVLGASLGAVFAEVDKGTASFKDLGRAALKASLDAIRGIVVEGVARAALSALKDTPYPINIVLAGVAGAAAGALFNGLTSSLTGLRDGGVVYGPTPVLVGEYAGAKSNPEVIAPLNKLKSIIGDSGGGAVQVYGRLSGEDILISSRRAAARQTRATGV